MMWQRAQPEGAAPARRVRAFSLLELIVVLVLMGLAVGLVAPAVARSSGAAREQNAAGELTTTLSAIRLETIRDGRASDVAIRQIDTTLVVATEGTTRAIEGWPLTMVGDFDRDIDTVEFSFDIHGRSTLERIRLRSTDTPHRLWSIDFDPVGGVPAVVRDTEASEAW